MTVIITLDDKHGYTLFGKRLSQDLSVAEDIISSFDLVYMSEYSAAQFTDRSKILTPIPADIPPDAVLFLETEEIPDNADCLIVYRWNRHYPSDRKYNPAKYYWYKKSSVNFPGRSHDRITKEVYTK